MHGSASSGADMISADRCTVERSKPMGIAKTCGSRQAAARIFSSADPLSFESDCPPTLFVKSVILAVCYSTRHSVLGLFTGDNCR
jgi:hypothetical protein